jgi:HEAT repeat protein
VRKVSVALALAFVLAPLAPKSAHALAWPDVAERIERDLSSTDPAKRRAAATSLGSLGAQRATPLLLGALADSDVEVRLNAAKQAADLGVVSATEATLPWLGEHDARLRAAACDISRAMPNPTVTVRPLSRALADSDPLVRAACAAALGAQRSTAATVPLSGKLDDPAPAVRSEVARALAKLGDPRAVMPLVGKVEDAAPEVRRDVVRALGALGDPRATQALLFALRDNAPEVKMAALGALGRLRAPEATVAITPITLERNREVRQAALAALGHIGTEDAVRALVSQLGMQDDAAESLEHTAVRDALVTAASVTTRFAREFIISTLTGLLDKPGPSAAKTSAAWILGELRATSSAPAIVSSLRKGTLAPAASMRALAKAATAEHVPVVLEFLADPNPQVRAEALAAANALLDPTNGGGDGRAVEPLVSSLHSPRISPQERATVATLLGRTGAPRAVAELTMFVTAKDLTLRLAAIDALGTLGRAAPNASAGVADDTLLPLLGDADPAVRLHAAIALGASGGSKAQSALVAKLDGGEELDRYAVLAALTGIAYRVASEGATARLVRELAMVAGPERDAVLEAMGAARLPSALRGLEAVSSGDVDDRRMVATLLGGHRGSAIALDRLDKLASDPDESVRAEAAFALGSVGSSATIARLASLTTEDTAVATNAAASIAKIAATLGPSQASLVTVAACPMLKSHRATVRANALVALANARARCGDGSLERKLAREDASSLVRANAARLLLNMIEAPTKPTSPPAHVTIFVFDQTATVARPHAPYLLEYQSGMLRMGMTDRRGATVDPAAPYGTVTLRPPEIGQK